METPAPAPSSAPTIVYGLEDRVPLGTALLVGAQHVAAMVVGTITPPLLLANALKFSAEDTAYFISAAFLASGLGAFLQCRRRGSVGSGLLSVTGTSFAFMQPLTQAWHAGGLPMMFGLSCLTAPVQMLLAPCLSRLRRVFTPLVSGVVVLLIGTSLIPTALFGLATPLRPDAPAWRWASQPAVPFVSRWVAFTPPLRARANGLPGSDSCPMALPFGGSWCRRLHSSISSRRSRRWAT